MRTMLLCATALLVATASIGCQSMGCHGRQYDCNDGCVYQPGFERPSLFSRLSSKKAKCGKDCPLCSSQSHDGGGWNYSNCSGPGNCSGPVGCSGPAGCSGPVNCSGHGPNCSAPMMNCAGGMPGCSAPSCGAPMPGNYSSCGMPASCSGCSGPVETPSCSSCGMPHAAPPVFDGNIIPGDPMTPPGPPAAAPAVPPTEPERTTSVPPPPVTMTIPSVFPEARPRHVHWVPTAVK